jgi:hypothetical protein
MTIAAGWLGYSAEQIWQRCWHWRKSPEDLENEILGSHDLNKNNVRHFGRRVVGVAFSFEPFRVNVSVHMSVWSSESMFPYACQYDPWSSALNDHSVAIIVSFLLLDSKEWFLSAPIFGPIREVSIGSRVGRIIVWTASDWKLSGIRFFQPCFCWICE